MKVAWIHNFPPEVENSGVFMHTLAQEVQKQGVEVLMVYTGPLRRPFGLLSAPKRLARQAQGCDLIHAQYGSACGYVAAKLPGPKILTLRGSDWYGVPPVSLKARLHRAACRWFTCTSLPSYNVVLVMSERMKRIVAARFNGQLLHVLPSGIDLAQFQPLDRLEARSRLGEENDKSPWILFSMLTTNNPVKRIDLGRAAVKLVQEQIPDVKLKIMSGRPHSQVPLLVNACDVLLLTSSHEGWPNIVKECLACNVPFVATDVGDLAAIAQAEPNCHIAAANAEELARCLVATLSHERSTSLRRHVEEMDMVKTARHLIQLYEDLLLRGES